MNAHMDFQLACGEDVKLINSNDISIITQLIGDKRDKVHPAPETFKEFCTKRVGDLNHSRQTWVRTDKVGKVTSALYGACFEGEISSPKDLQGDVAQILRGESTAIIKSVESVSFYSVGAFGKGEGAKIIRAAHRVLSQMTPQATLSTLSPLRGFKGWLHEKGVSPSSGG